MKDKKKIDLLSQFDLFVKIHVLQSLCSLLPGGPICNFVMSSLGLSGISITDMHHIYF